MHFLEPIRILSDIHLGHPASLVRSPSDLAPLFQGVSTVVFNGDTVEHRFRKDQKPAGIHLKSLKTVCTDCGATPVLINGNHDPRISSFNHLDLADGAVLVTHGDMLFHDISPWSFEAGIMGKEHRKALEEMGEDAFSDFEKRLHANKRGSMALELHESTLPHGPMGRFVVFVRAAWPPWRPFEIIHCWLSTPGKAVELARTFRPASSFVIIGHTHYCGIWKRDPRTIINTGSFLPISARTLIDLEDGRLTVRKIIQRRGKFEAGKTVAEFKVRKLKPSGG